MPADNKQLARRIFDEIWSEGKLDLLDELVDEDIVAHPRGMSEEVRGRGAMKDFVARMRESFPDMTFTIEDQVAEGDKVVSRWVTTGTHDGEFMGVDATGRSVRMTGITIQRFRDGKVVEGWTDLDMLGVMMQIGAIPQPARA